MIYSDRKKKKRKKEKRKETRERERERERKREREREDIYELSISIGLLKAIKRVTMVLIRSLGTRVSKHAAPKHNGHDSLIAKANSRQANAFPLNGRIHFYLLQQKTFQELPRQFIVCHFVSPQPSPWSQ